MKIEYVVTANTLCDSPKYPNAVIQYDLEGETGNAYYILGVATKALQGQGVSKEDRDKFLKQAMSGDYWDLRATVAMWVTAIELGEYADDATEFELDDDDDEYDEDD